MMRETEKERERALVIYLACIDEQLQSSCKQKKVLTSAHATGAYFGVCLLILSL